MPAFVRRHWPWALSAIFATSVYRAWLMPGFLLGDDQFRFSDAFTRSFFPWRNAWDSSVLFGAPSAYSSPAYPLWSLIGLLSRSGLGFDVGERVVWFWPLLALLVISPYVLSYRLTRSTWAAALATALFSVNTWTISLVQRGHIGSLVSYALLPLVVWTIICGLRRPSFASSIGLAALLAVQCMYDLRYAYLSMICYASFSVVRVLRALFAGRYDFARRVGGAIVVLFIGGLVFNIYWILPQVVTPARLPAGYDSLGYFLSGSSFESLAHALALFMPFYHYVQGTDPFERYPVEPAFYVVPAVVALSLIAVRRHALALPIAILALAGVVITSGPASTFGDFVRFAFERVPGMTLFRDISKFTALIALAYSVSIALGYARLAACARFRLGARAAAAMPIAAVGLLICYVTLMHDAYNPMRQSNFTTSSLSGDDRSTQHFLDEQQGFFRTLVVPTWRPELVGTSMHPLVSADLLLTNAQQDGGMRELFDRRENVLDRLESSLVPSILAEAGVRYVVVIDPPTGGLYAPFQYDIQHAQTLDVLASRSWLRERARFGRYVVFAVTGPIAPRAFFASSPATFAGDPIKLTALVGSPWWGDRPGVMTFPDPAAARSTSFDPHWPTIIAGATDRAPENAEAWAVSPLAQPTDPPVRPAEVPNLKFALPKPASVVTWMEARPPATISVARDLFVDPADLAPFDPPSEELLGPSILRADLDDVRLVSAPLSNDPSGAVWFGIVGGRADLTITNVDDAPLRADVTIVMRSPDRLPRWVTAQLGGISRLLEVPGAIGSGRDGARIVVSDLSIPPGTSKLTLSVPGDHDVTQYSVFVRDDVRMISKETPAGESPVRMIASESETADGLDVEAHPSATGARSQTSAFRILKAEPIALDRRPLIDVRYSAPRAPLAMALSLQIRRRIDGRTFRVIEPLLRTSTDRSVDVFDSVQHAIDDRRADVDVRVRSSEASDFELDTVVLMIVAPGRSPAERYVAHLYDATLTAAPIPNVPVVLDATPVSFDGSRLGGQAGSCRRMEGSGVRELVVRTTGSRRCEVDVPLPNASGATKLAFWLRTSPALTADARLRFTSDTGATLDVVPEGPRAFTDPDQPIPNAWTSAVGPFGQTAGFQRFDVDVQEVQAFRLPDRGRVFRLTALVVDVEPAAGHQPSSDDSASLIDPTLVFGSKETELLRTPVGFTIDHTSRALSWRWDARSGRFTSSSQALALTAGLHSLTLAPPAPVPVEGAVIARASSASRAGTGIVDDHRAIADSEYGLSLHGNGGLLVFTDASFDGWRLALTRADAPNISGNALLDWWELRSSWLPQDAHVTVDDIFNGWTIPAGSYTAIAFYVPEAVSEGSALLWIVLSIPLGVLALLKARPYKR